MTIKKYIRKKTLILIGVIIITGIFFNVPIHMRLESPTITIIQIISAIVGIASILYIIFFIKCPRCNGSLRTHVFEISFSNEKTNESLNYCPYCGVNLDEKL